MGGRLPVRTDPAWFVASDRAFLQAHLSEKGFILLAEGPEGPPALVVKYPGDEPEHLGRMPDCRRLSCPAAPIWIRLPFCRKHAEIACRSGYWLRQSRIVSFPYCHWLLRSTLKTAIASQNFMTCGYRVAATRKSTAAWTAIFFINALSRYYRGALYLAVRCLR